MQDRYDSQTRNKRRFRAALCFTTLFGLFLSTNIHRDIVKVPPLSSLEILDLKDRSRRELCLRGEVSDSKHCEERLHHNRACTWWEEVSSYFQLYENNVTYFRTLAQRPCKSRPKLKMKQFPEPVCTKTSILRDSDTLLCDSWNIANRSTVAMQRLWYQQVGVWEVFRQAYYNSKQHRNKDASLLCKFSDSSSTKRILEYGSGVAPFSTYVLLNCPGKLESISIVDVPAEHLYFALWRLRYKLNHVVGKSATLRGYEIREEALKFPPGSLDLIVIITVLEHLPNPFDVIKMLLVALARGGILFEDFCAKTPGITENFADVTRDTSDPNLGIARVQRQGTIDYIKTQCTLLHGDYGMCSKRLWKC